MAEQHARRRLPISAASPAAARRFTGERLVAWGYEEHCEVAQLLVSEIVTNAVRHGRSICILDLTASSEGIHVAVTDDGAGRPEVQHPSPDDVSGRGLAIVEALASGWGVETVPSGKVVWFELRDTAVTPGTR
jgi:anti-sigma regulatory factor (Ser/Thr protein kinase)